jgi:hypothetical protein
MSIAKQGSRRWARAAGNCNFTGAVAKLGDHFLEEPMNTKRIVAFGPAIAFASLLMVGPGAHSQTGQEGRTSGPAAGTPTHMGSSGTSSTGTKHQEDVVRDQSQAVKGTPESSGSSGTSQAPGGPATGRPGTSGTESGPAPQPNKSR